MSEIRLALFDFDGTVADNGEGICRCIDYALDKMGYPPLSETVKRKFIGPSLYDSFMKYCGNDPEKAEEFVRFYRERYEPIGLTECSLYEDVPAVLKKLREDGVKAAVCSGKPKRFVIRIAESRGIGDLFDAFFCPDGSTHSSTKDEFILQAAAHFGVQKENIVMIGDRCFDILSAKKAGVLSMGVRYGFAEEGELEESGADVIAETPMDIYTWIKENNTK